MLHPAREYTDLTEAFFTVGMLYCLTGTRVGADARASLHRVLQNL